MSAKRVSVLLDKEQEKTLSQAASKVGLQLGQYLRLRALESAYRENKVK